MPDGWIRATLGVVLSSRRVVRIERSRFPGKGRRPLLTLHLDCGHRRIHRATGEPPERVTCTFCVLDRPIKPVPLARKRANQRGRRR